MSQEGSATPQILHLSLRLAPLTGKTHWYGQGDRPPADGLGIALYFIFGVKGRPSECEEYGLAFNLPLTKLDELLKSGEVLIHEVDPEDAKGGPVPEGQMLPIENMP